jgi:hypothetical protein
LRSDDLFYLLSSRKLTGSVMNDAAGLESKRAAIFQQITSHIAGDLGFGSSGFLSDEQRSKVADEVQRTIEEWEELVELEARPLEPITRLQHLLRSYHDACEEMLDLRSARRGR